MATRLIGTDSTNPRLPDSVIAASVGTGADDLAPGDTLTDANSYTDSEVAPLEARIAVIEAGGGGGVVIPPTPGTLDPVDAAHTVTSSSPPLTVTGGTVSALVPANSNHVHTASSPALLPDGPVEMTLTAGATSFTPWVQLQPGSTATVTWRRSDGSVITTGLKPTITPVPADKVIRMFVTDGGLPAMNEVDYLNLGFDSGQDAGLDNIGSTYNHPGQPIRDIYGIQLLTGMRYFMAANTPLATFLNLTGMTNLLHVECFGADITSLTLTGCTSLIRVCVEACAIEEIDFSTVKNNIHDLRCAHNVSAAPIVFSSDGPLTNLYHYCVRGQPTAQHLTMAQLPAVVQWWTSLTGITNIDPPISPVLNSVMAEGNPINAADVDGFLIGLAATGPTSNPYGLFDMQDADPPTAASAAARATLTSRGWLLNIPLPGTMAGDGTNGTWTAPTHQPWVQADLTYIEGSATVTGGVLTTNTNGYQRCIMRPGGRNTGDVFFEVMVDRTQIDGHPGTDWWALMANANAQGNGGIRVFIHWSAVNPGDATGILVGMSSAWFSAGDHGTTTRVASNPAGWTNPGNHKVGLYHGGDTIYITFDGVKVYKARGRSTDLYQQGGYVGVVGDSYGTNRVFQSWGIANVTLP